MMMRIILFLCANILLVSVSIASSNIKQPLKKVLTKEISQEVFLPQILSDADVERYKKAFKFQRLLQKKRVANLVKQLENPLLLGHLKSERVLHKRTRTSYKDLQNWLAKYSDHYQADRIYKLANRRAPKGALHAKPKEASVSVSRYSDPDDKFETSPEKIRRTKERKKLLRNLSYNLKKGFYSSAFKKLQLPTTRKVLGDDAFADISYKLAKILLEKGHFATAYKTAELSAKVAVAKKPKVLWIKGFSAYRLGHKDQAVQAFRELVYTVPVNSKYYPLSTFWAARTYEELGKHGLAKVFFNMASHNITDFYGQLAAQKLGTQQKISWDLPKLDQKKLDILLKEKTIRRVIALSQIGEYGMAQRELKGVYDRLPTNMDETLLGITLRINLPNVSYTLAHNLKQQEHKTYMAGFYPLPKWVPAGGFKMDAELMFSVMRQESAFNPFAISRSGARGLMQIMPATATYIRHKQGRGRISKQKLSDPKMNMNLSQFYLNYLMDKMNGNLLHVIAGYNGGPGNINKWISKGVVSVDDPVLFVESIPYAETKHYTKKVFANLWMYQKRFGKVPATLMSMAENHWPIVLASQKWLGEES